MLSRTAATAPLAAPAPTARRAAARAGPLRVAASVQWSLVPKLGGKSIDLTASIGERRVAGVCTTDWHDKNASAVCDTEFTDLGGIHVLFEAEGTSNPLDSPSALFIKDEDSHQPVFVDGKILFKFERRQVRPGSVIKLAGTEFRVERDVVAHA